jgi:Bacterial transcriptional activator domain.
MPRTAIHGLVAMLVIGQFLTACDLLFPEDSAHTAKSSKSASKKVRKRKKKQGTTDGVSEEYQSFLEVPTKAPEDVMRRYLPNEKKQAIGPKELIDAAKKALDDKDYDACEVIADRLVKLSPNTVDGYAWRGRARSLSVHGRDEEAMADLTRAISMGTNGNGRPYEGMARIMDTRGDRKKAIEFLDEAIKIEPKEHDYLKYRAAMRADLGDFAGARADYDKAVEVRGSAACYFQRGRFLETQKDYEQSLADYASAIEVEKKNGLEEKTAVCHKFRTELLIKLGRHKEAVDECTRALKDDPTDDEFLRMRGKEYVALKKYTEAERDLSAAIKNAPEISPDAYEARASIYELQGKAQLAKSDRKIAKELRDKPAETQLYQQ